MSIVAFLLFHIFKLPSQKNLCFHNLQRIYLLRSEIHRKLFPNCSHIPVEKKMEQKISLQVFFVFSEQHILKILFLKVI